MKRRNLKSVLICTFLVLIGNIGYAQTSNNTNLPPKVEHMEPLYIDLVRDLGARKGEKELNLGSDFIND